MEIDLIARAIGQPWAVLWPKLKRLHEPRDTGRALEPEEKNTLLELAAKNRSPLPSDHGSDRFYDRHAAGRNQQASMAPA